MEKVSLLTLPNELICEIASYMCIRDIISMIQCYRNLCQPLLWHCQHQHQSQELREALTACIQAGDLDATRLLLSINADIELIKDEPQIQKEQPPDYTSGHYWDDFWLGLAVRGGHDEIVEALAEHLGRVKIEIPALKVNCVGDALNSAAEGGYFAMTRALLDIDNEITRSSNYYDKALEDCSCSKQKACSARGQKSAPDYFATVKLLLDSGTNSNWPESPFGSFVSSCEPLALALDTCRLISDGTVKLLVERGADMSAEDVLHTFTDTSNQCTISHGGAAEFLLDHGANLSSRDSLGRSILTKARKRDLIQVFIARGLNPDDVDESGKTLLDALATEEASETRIEMMKHPDYETHFSFVRKTAKLLLSYGADLSIRDDEEQILLYKTDTKSLVELILDYGAGVNVVDSYGQTPLHTMVYGASRDKVETIKLLLDNGADLGAENADGNTSLHLASLTSSWDVVKLLLQHGADQSSRNLNGETPMDL
ncbi:hypothetical protein PENVUL_c041G06291 [Penicillium vulpinum]|uniref:Uncharacterized protein n=1 Tax=Penicillium vulpinum TaxID=29845 RepID=A0A1V6RJG0_9EURO|nr:hypothetical protein PENVUL_c041G06291 [Penicillium vulpinum]